MTPVFSAIQFDLFIKVINYPFENYVLVDQQAVNLCFKGRFLTSNGLRRMNLKPAFRARKPILIFNGI